MSKLRMLPVNEYRVNHWGLLLGLDKRRGQKLNKREGEEEQKVLGRRDGPFTVIRRPAGW